MVFVFSVTLTLTFDLCSIVCHTHCAWCTGLAMRSFIIIHPVILGDMPRTHTHIHTHTHTHTHTEGHSNSLSARLTIRNNISTPNSLHDREHFILYSIHIYCLISKTNTNYISTKMRRTFTRTLLWSIFYKQCKSNKAIRDGRPRPPRHQGFIAISYGGSELRHRSILETITHRPKCQIQKL